MFVQIYVATEPGRNYTRLTDAVAPASFDIQARLPPVLCHTQPLQKRMELCLYATCALLQVERVATTKSSGANFVDRTGCTYGLWTVISRTAHIKKVRWLCRCACGTERTVASSDLRSGRTLSCGCRKKARAGTGVRAKFKSTHISWIGMKQRVNYPGHIEYHRYGGRGITMFEGWVSFERFLADMGPRPEGHSLDRIDMDGPYCPENCRWASRAEQCSNTSKNVFVEYKGERFTLKQLAQNLCVNYYTLHGAYRKRGLSLEESIARAIAGRRGRSKPTANSQIQSGFSPVICLAEPG